MSLVATAPGTWSPDVLAYAERFGIRQYLDEFVARTRRLFPTARSLEVFTEPDPEIRDLVFLVFELHVPKVDVPDFLAADRIWHDEYHELVPGPYQAAVCLSLYRDPE